MKSILVIDAPEHVAIQSKHVHVFLNVFHLEDQRKQDDYKTLLGRVREPQLARTRQEIIFSNLDTIYIL